MAAGRVLSVGLLALLVALVLPTTAHGDFLISAFNSSLILTDHPNFYHALADEPTAVFPTGLSGGPYGPLFYYPTALWLLVLDKLQLIDVAAWEGPNDGALQSLRTVFLLKLPNLAVYLLAGLVLLRTLPGERGETAAGLWLANPAVLLFSLMMGQNDGWAALASLASLLCALRAIEERPVEVGGRRLPLRTLAMVALAAGGAAKLSPVLLAPAFAWLLGRDTRERVLLAGAAGAAFLIAVGPFLGNEYFREHGLFGRQVGQVPRIPFEGAAAVYGGYLAAVLLAARRDADRVRVLLFAFVAFHALIMLVAGWTPQRSVLFIAALAFAVPVRRAFIVPYVAVTAFALLLALEHRNELASGLFEPLSPRVALIPPLIEDGGSEPLHSVLFWLAGASWLAVLPSFWLARPEAPRPARWSPAFGAPVLASVLVLYVAASLSLVPRGIETVPYRERAPPQPVAAGQTFAFFFFASHDELRSVAFEIEGGGGPAAVEVTGAGGALSVRRDVALETGRNEIETGRIEDSAGELFRVAITPREPVVLRMAAVPPELAVAGAELDGEPLGATAAYRVAYRTTWGALARDVRLQLRDGWYTIVAAFALSAAGLGALGLARRGRRAARPGG